MSVLQEFQSTTAAVLDRVGPDVVLIGRDGRGTGVVVDEGAVLTNAHNLRGDSVTVVFGDGRSESGSVGAVDVDGDLAVVRVATGDSDPVEWAGSDRDVAVGSPVFALSGSPSLRPRITFGTVSAVDQAFRGPRGRRIDGGIEHTAPLPRGASGGPVVDGDGRLLGINTHRLGDGFYLARPVDADLRRRVDQLLDGVSPRRRSLGVALAPPRVAARLRAAVGLEPRDGLLVRDVDADGPAGAAGLQEGDLIVGLGGEAVTEVDQVHAALDRLDPDGDLELTIVRGVDELTVTVGFEPLAE
jgi:serine protease Do